MIEKAKQVLQNEADAILRLKELIDEQFTQSLELIFHAKGRIVVTGIGKSALLKRWSLLLFTSTPAPCTLLRQFMAFRDIQRDDVVICLSKVEVLPKFQC